jgi:metal-responsive CopG/Arc/MetJ family transcriptional regulator
MRRKVYTPTSDRVFSSVFAKGDVLVPLVIRLDQELEKGLDEMSQEQGVPKAELVRALLRERLAQRRKRIDAYKIASELGVIGIDDDPRKDVAQNHSKYLRAALRGKRHP